MNTTSMEFVIAQEKTGKNPSVLSEFMGISKNMEEALLVNPWNLGVGIFVRFLSCPPSSCSLHTSFIFVSFAFTSFILTSFAYGRTLPLRSTKVS